MVASTRHQLSYQGQYVPLGRTGLASGPHVVEVSVRTPKLVPGVGGRPWPIGPLALSRAGSCDGANL